MAKKKLVSSAQVSAAEATYTAFMVGKLTRMGAGKAAAKFRGDGPLIKRQTKKWLQRFSDDGGDVGDMAAFMAWLLEHADEIISFISKIIILFAIALLLMVGFASSASAQVTIEPTGKMGDVRVAKLAIEPIEGATHTVEISSDDGTKFVQYGNDIPVWPAAPGAHWIEAKVKTEIHKTEDVLVPGPAWPENKDDIAKKTLTYLVDKYEKTYRADFSVDGVVPPGPGPVPPTPVPGDFAGKCRAWLQAVPAASYSKEKVIAVADNYLTIGSQGSDPARSGGWTAATFGDRMKALNVEALGIDGVGAWREPFFRPLATYQAKLISERGISESDIQKIAAMWTETGEAIKAAAY